MTVRLYFETAFLDFMRCLEEMQNISLKVKDDLLWQIVETFYLPLTTVYIVIQLLNGDCRKIHTSPETSSHYHHQTKSRVTKLTSCYSKMTSAQNYQFLKPSNGFSSPQNNDFFNECCTRCMLPTLSPIWIWGELDKYV